MKNLKLFAVFQLVAAISAFDKEIYTQLLKNAEDIIDECAEEIHPTDDDLSELYGFKLPPTSHEAKCMIYCIYDSVKAVDDNGMFRKGSSWSALAKFKLDNPTIYRNLVRTMQICARDVEITNDRCENVSNIAACWLKNESGFDIKN